MSHHQRIKSFLVCDVCPRTLTWSGALSKTAARRTAKEKHGWRTDKLNRDICPAHPKLKGARNA